MDGRLYDPLVGRMFSPDPYIPDGTNTQDYNKYIYARNNPLKYNDPDGEWVNIVVGAAIGGVVNLGVQAIKGNVNTFGDGLKYFGVGALAGGIAGATGVYVGGLVNAGGFVGGATIGGASGFAGGFVGGAGNAWVGGATFGQGLGVGLKSGAYGAIGGAIIGGLASGFAATGKGGRFWDGDPKTFKLSSLENEDGLYPGDGDPDGEHDGWTLKNRSGKTIHYKPDNDVKRFGLSQKGAYPLKHGRGVNFRIDGVTHHKYPGQVFKTADFTDHIFGVQATSNGIEYNTIFEPLGTELNHFMGGGWLSTPPDGNWFEIFNAAGYVFK